MTASPLEHNNRGETDDEWLAALHARISDSVLDEEAWITMRVLEQALVRRGRVDVLLLDGVWALTEDDPEYRMNELVRAAFHRSLGVIPIEHLERDHRPAALPAARLRGRTMVGRIDIELPQSCCVCSNQLDPETPFFLAHPNEALVCERCVDRYDLVVWDERQLESGDRGDFAFDG
jgi:hypothetical protein